MTSFDENTPPSVHCIFSLVRDTTIIINKTKVRLIVMHSINRYFKICIIRDVLTEKEKNVYIPISIGI